MFVGDKRLAIGYADKDPGERNRGPERFPSPDKLFFSMYGIGKPLDVAGWSLRHDGAALGCLQVSGNASLSDKADKKAIRDISMRSNPAVAPFPDAANLLELIDHPSGEVQEGLLSSNRYTGPFAAKDTQTDTQDYTFSEFR